MLQQRVITSSTTEQEARTILFGTSLEDYELAYAAVSFCFKELCSREKRWWIIYKRGCCSPLTQTLCYWQLRKDAQPALNHLAAFLSICSLSNMYLKHVFSIAGSMTSIGCPFTAGKLVGVQALRLRT